MMASRVTPITMARSFNGMSAVRTGGERRAVLMLLPVVMLIIIGLGAVLSASSVVGIRSAGGDQFFFVKRQVAFIGVGLIAFAVTVRLPYRWYARFAVPILVLAIVGLVATLAIGEVRGGARRWIDLGPISIQTSEFAKFAVVVFLATTLSRKERWLTSLTHVAVPVLASVGSVAVLLLLQPDLGTTVLIAATAFAIVAVSAAPLRHLLVLGVTGIVGALLLAKSQPYRWERVTTFLNPDADPLGAGLQSFQSLVALGTGGLFGIGLGASRARWSYLPNAHTDFIFAIIGEETGLAGSLVVIALFVTLAIVGVTIAMKAPDRLGRLLAIGLVAWLTFQALINIGGVTRVMPITGVPLPFVSSGGSAMIVNLAVIGVLVNIARSAGRVESDLDQ